MKFISKALHDFEAVIFYAKSDDWNIEIHNGFKKRDSSNINIGWY
jgi:hypothetical protein